jgi:hypothetical protein
MRSALISSMLFLLGGFAMTDANAADRPLRLSWQKNILTVEGDHLPSKKVEICYLEAYCRDGSTDRVWGETTIGHKTELVSISKDRLELKLRCTLTDGVTVDHTIRTGNDAVSFELKAHNPTKVASRAHWAQPCVRVGPFTGRTQKTYLDKSFVFLNDKLSRLPTPNWVKKARYIPGQVWAPKGVHRNDVNPRPLSDDIPSNGLIGCFSGDEKMILAGAWEPYQELFQGVIVCLHSDFRIGGLKAGETKKIRGKLYLVDANVDALLKRYRKDFPEHAKP